MVQAQSVVRGGTCSLLRARVSEALAGDGYRQTAKLTVSVRCLSVAAPQEPPTRAHEGGEQFLSNHRLRLNHALLRGWDGQGNAWDRLAPSLHDGRDGLRFTR